MAVDSVVDTGALVYAHDDGPVRVITLHRPERHNALVPELVDGVRAAIRTAAAAPAVRAVVLTAEGPNFSTGGDVAEFAARSGPQLARYAREIVGGLNAMMLDLIGLDVPVVAAVHGAVTGGSLGFVLASDVVVASSDATFAPYYVDVGFSPDGGWTALLPDRIGPVRAMSVQLGNRILDARTAQDWGLVAELVTSGDVRDAAIGRAQLFAAKKPAAIRRTKRLLWGDLSVIAARLDAELESFIEQVVTDEATAGMAAFLARDNSSAAPTH
ncbi:MAG: enoyl-CoA hydratase/isomerase family protein [Jiangellaceae bacterium]